MLHNITLIDWLRIKYLQVEKIKLKIEKKIFMKNIERKKENISIYTLLLELFITLSKLTQILPVLLEFNYFVTKIASIPLSSLFFLFDLSKFRLYYYT
jgi:hypothetical protein